MVRAVVTRLSRSRTVFCSNRILLGDHSTGQASRTAPSRCRTQWAMITSAAKVIGIVLIAGNGGSSPETTRRCELVCGAVEWSLLFEWLARALRWRPQNGIRCLAMRKSVRQRLQMGPDERAVRGVRAVWIEAVNAGDLACLRTLMADDVVFLSPGRAPVGRDGFSAGFSAAHEQARIRCISDLEEVVVVGEVAYTRSRDALSVIPRIAGEATRLAGHRITVYRKHSGDRWLLARDAHTLSPVEMVEDT